MSVRNPLVATIHTGTACVNMVMFLQNGCTCDLNDVVGVKQVLDQNFIQSFDRF